MWTERHAAVIASVFDALNQSDIRWMVLRNHEGLPVHNRSKDVDLAISKSDWRHARALVDGGMKSHGFDRVQNVVFQYADCNTYFCLNSGQLVSLKIDFLDGFDWRGARIAGFDELYDRCQVYGEFKIPSRQDDGFMLWVKPLLTGGIIKERYARDILQCLRDDPTAFHSNLERIFGKRMACTVWPLLEQGDLQSTVRYQAHLRRAAWFRAISLKPWATTVSLIGHARCESIRRIWRSKGSLLAVVGPDGVGKTTFLDGFCQDLAHVLVKDVEAIRVRHFRPHLFPNLKRLFAGQRYNPATEEFSRPHRAKPVGAASSLCRLTYYWLDYLIGYWLRIRPQCLRHNVVVFDRYCFDFVVDPRRSRLGLPLWVRRLFQRLTPQPDLVFFLDCDPDTVYARKQELEREEIVRQLEAYRELARREPRRFVRLDATQSPDASRLTAMAEYCERMFAPL